jgi:hypothetical protein
MNMKDDRDYSLFPDNQNEDDDDNTMDEDQPQ